MITVRPLQEDDEARWTELWRGYHAFYEATVDAAIYPRNFRRLLSADHPEMQALVADRDGATVGLVHYIFHRHNWRMEDVVYLQDLFVDPSTRGGGVGRKLIEAVYAAADEANCPMVYWMTQEFNYRGRMLYDQVADRTPFIKYQR